MIIRILLPFLLLISSSLYAQNFKGGLTAGLITSTVWGDNLAGFRQAGLMAGGYVQYPINNILNFQPEILYEALGSKDGAGVQGLRTQYISLPLLINANFGLTINEKLYTIRLDAGPSIGYLLDAKDSFSRLPLTGDYFRLDPKMVGGLVFKFSEKIFLHTRLTLSTFSIVRTAGRRNHCFIPQPGYCNYYATFGVRYKIM